MPELTSTPSPGEQHDEEATQNLASTSAEIDHPSVAALTLPFLVVHQNDSGHTFVTRVTAPTIEEAKSAVLHAHADNTVVDAMLDHGEVTHAYGGTVLEVHSLAEEP